MNYSPIIQQATWTQVTAAVLLIFGALAGIEAVIRGAQFLVDAISGSDEDDDDEDDEQDND